MALARAHARKRRTKWRNEMDGIGRRGLIKGVGLALGAAPLGLFAPHVARAQSDAWPNRPVRFVVPLAAGGGLDFVARLVAEHVSRSLGQQIFIENKTGAGGTIGIDTAIKSTPDGYTFLLTYHNVANAPYVLRLDDDFFKDFLPVCCRWRP